MYIYVNVSICRHMYAYMCDCVCMSVCECVCVSICVNPTNMQVVFFLGLVFPALSGPDILGKCCFINTESRHYFCAGRQGLLLEMNLESHAIAPGSIHSGLGAD